MKTADGPVAIDETAAETLACDAACEEGALRERVLARDGRRGVACGRPVDLHAHHVAPRAEGGPDADWNLVTLCRPCHGLLHDGRLFFTGRAPHGVTMKDSAGNPIEARTGSGAHGIEVALGGAQAPRPDSQVVELQDVPSLVGREVYESHAHLFPFDVAARRRRRLHARIEGRDAPREARPARAPRARAAAPRRPHRPVARRREPLARRAPGAEKEKSAGTRPSHRGVRPRQDDARARARRGDGEADAGRAGAAGERGVRDPVAPPRPRAGRRPLRGRDPRAQEGRRGVALRGARGGADDGPGALAGSGAEPRVRAAALHARRRDDRARGAAGRARVAVLDPGDAFPLQRGRAGGDREAVGAARRVPDQGGRGRARPRAGVARAPFRRGRRSGSRSA